MADSPVIAMPDKHALAGLRSIRLDRLAGEAFVSLPPYEGSVLPDRLRRLVLVPLDESSPEVHMHAAWRNDDDGPAVRAVLTELFDVCSTPYA